MSIAPIPGQALKSNFLKGRRLAILEIHPERYLLQSNPAQYGVVGHNIDRCVTLIGVHCRHINWNFSIWNPLAKNGPPLPTVVIAGLNLATKTTILAAKMVRPTCLDCYEWFYFPRYMHASNVRGYIGLNAMHSYTWLPLASRTELQGTQHIKHTDHFWQEIFAANFWSAWTNFGPGPILAPDQIFRDSWISPRKASHTLRTREGRCGTYARVPAPPTL